MFVLSRLFTGSTSQQNPQSNRNSPVRVVRLRSIHEIDEELWDSVNDREDLFHTHRFIRSVEDAGLENSRFWYLLFYLGDRLVGTAALSSFTVSLDLLVEGSFRKLIAFLRQWVPHFLRVKILFCGLPVSIGKNALTISEPSCSEGILELLVREIEKIGRQEGIWLLCIKEFLKSETKLVDQVTQHGFFRSCSLPSMRMKIRWKSFESYLASMRHDYRRPILQSLKKLSLSKPLIQGSTVLAEESEKPVLVLADSSICPPKEFYGLYLNVMERAEVKLETLNESFFENVCTNLNGEIELLAVAKERKLLATSLLALHRGTMTFLLAGLDYSDRDKYDVYFNLIYGIVSLAIERGCTSLDLGQTPYWVKQRIGGEASPVYFYMRAERWYLHRCLKLFHPFLFPEKRLQTLNVFREQPPAGVNNEDHWSRTRS